MTVIVAITDVEQLMEGGQEFPVGCLSELKSSCINLTVTPNLGSRGHTQQGAESFILKSQGLVHIYII